MRDKIFFAICFGFILGTFLRSFLFINNYLAFVFLIIACALILFYFLSSKNIWIIFLGFFILFFSFGILRFSQKDNQIQGIFDDQLGQKISLTGFIVNEPNLGDQSQKLEVQLENQKIRFLLNTSLENNFNYGDQISFSGKLTQPDNFTTDTGKEFDYINYLRKDNILYRMNYPQIEIISSHNGFWLKSSLFKLKNKFLEEISFLIPDPESALLGGLILGERSSLSDSLKENFIKTGTIHIVALSGYNVSIISEWIMKLFSFLSLNVSIYFGIVSIFLFVLMTGANSTAIRAGLMAILMLFARATGRNYDVFRALLLTAFLMILFNPFILFFDISFQLSFIATIAVIFFSPRIERYFFWVPKQFKMRDIICVTFSAYLFVLPFILFKMGNLSIVALPANILILPFIPLTMAFGFFSGFIGLFSPLLAMPISYLTYLFLSYELFIVNFFAEISFASFSISNFPLLITLAIYAYFIYFLFGKSIKKFFLETEN